MSMTRRTAITMAGLALLDGATGYASRRRAIRVPPRISPIEPASRYIATGVPAQASAPGPLSAYGSGPSALGLGIHNCGWGCAQDLNLTLTMLKPQWVRSGAANVIYPADPQDPLLTDLVARGMNILYTVGGENGKEVDESLVVERLRSAMAAYPSITHFQLLNEPGNFHNMDPEQYVKRAIIPGRKVIDEENRQRAAAGQPPVRLVSTGFFGTPRGVEETRAAMKAGMGKHIDILGAHLYGETAVECAKQYRNLAGKLPVFVTEYGVDGYDLHERWYFDVGEQIEKALGGRTFNGQEQALFWYVLAGDRQYGLVHEWRGRPEYTSRLGELLEYRAR